MTNICVHTKVQLEGLSPLFRTKKPSGLHIFRQIILFVRLRDLSISDCMKRHRPQPHFVLLFDVQNRCANKACVSAMAEFKTLNCWVAPKARARARRSRRARAPPSPSWTSSRRPRPTTVSMCWTSAHSPRSTTSRPQSRRSRAVWAVWARPPPAPRPPAPGTRDPRAPWTLCPPRPRLCLRPSRSRPLATIPREYHQLLLTSTYHWAAVTTVPVSARSHPLDGLQWFHSDCSADYDIRIQWIQCLVNSD